MHERRNETRAGRLSPGPGNHGSRNRNENRIVLQVSPAAALAADRSAQVQRGGPSALFSHYLQLVGLLHRAV